MSSEKQLPFQPGNLTGMGGKQPGLEVDEHTILNELLEKLSQQILAAGKRNTVKEELMLTIKLLLTQYRDLKHSSFISSIENYIQSDVENQCSIYLTDDEVSSLWIQ